jgi:hypothetical protein
LLLSFVEMIEYAKMMLLRKKNGDRERRIRQS